MMYYLQNVYNQAAFTTQHRVNKHIIRRSEEKNGKNFKESFLKFKTKK